MFPHFWYMMTLLFPFKNPIKPDTLIFGGISTSMCTWSGHISASIIFTPFHSHNCLSIFPIASRFSLKNTFLRYFGANTIWYLQFHFVCDKLFMSFRLILNVLLLLFFLQLADRSSIIAKGVFISSFSLKLF